LRRDLDPGLFLRVQSALMAHPRAPGTQGRSIKLLGVAAS
jgi:hypothetical protein